MPSSSGGGRFAGALAETFRHAIRDHQAGRLDQAELGYRRVLRAMPHHVGSLQNLGVICRGRGRREEALGLYRRALAQAPDNPALHLNIGNLLYDLGRHGEAEKHLRIASQAAAETPSALYGLAQALYSQDKIEEAAAAFRRLVEVTPDHPKGWRNLAVCLDKLGRKAEALEAYERLLALDPGNEDARFLVDAKRGRSSDRAPAAYVQRFFDGYAEGFESHLRGSLAYRTPELLLDLLTRHMVPEHRFARALDLGCGTGLMGPLLRPFCARLDGVDLSPGMIGHARAKACYDELSVDDIVAFLAGTGIEADLVVAADVLVYLGDLEPLFVGVAARSAEGGLFLFSTEHGQDGEDFTLLPKARYRHAAAYLHRLAAAHGFTPVAGETAPIRLEPEGPVIGGLYLLRKVSMPR